MPTVVVILGSIFTTTASLNGAGGPLSSSDAPSRTQTRPLYGLSPVFRVARPPKTVETYVWVASMTAESEGTSYGYSRGFIGSVSPDEFTVGDSTFSVDGIRHEE